MDIQTLQHQVQLLKDQEAFIANKAQAVQVVTNCLKNLHSRIAVNGRFDVQLDRKNGNGNNGHSPKSDQQLPHETKSE